MGLLKIYIYHVGIVDRKLANYANISYWWQWLDMKYNSKFSSSMLTLLIIASTGYILLGSQVSFALTANQTNIQSKLPKSLMIHTIFGKKISGNSTMYNVTAYNLTGTPGQITSQYYKLGQVFDKKAGIKSGQLEHFVFKNGTEITAPYSGNYQSPIAKKFLEDVFIPLDGTNPCWIPFNGAIWHFADCPGPIVQP